DPGIRGMGGVRQSAGAEGGGAGLLARLDGGRRHRLAGVAIVAGARRRPGEAEFEPRRRRRDLVEDRERGGHDLRPDAVAGQDRDVEAVVGEHAMLFTSVFSKTGFGYCHSEHRKLHSPGSGEIVDVLEAWKPQREGGMRFCIVTALGQMGSLHNGSLEEWSTI